MNPNYWINNPLNDIIISPIIKPQKRQAPANISNINISILSPILCKKKSQVQVPELIMSNLEKPEICRQKTCVDTFNDLKEVYYFCKNGYGKNIKINGKHVIYKHTKTLFQNCCSMHPHDVDRNVKQIGFTNGLCDIGDFIVVQDPMKCKCVKKLCQI